MRVLKQGANLRISFENSLKFFRILVGGCTHILYSINSNNSEIKNYIYYLALPSALNRTFPKGLSKSS